MANKNKSPFYITTTLPYVNAQPHIGFSWEIVEADALARFHRLIGDEVFFNTGTDEHGIKVYRKAEEQNMDPQAYCDEMAKHFQELKSLLDLSYTRFIRTTDKDHIAAAQEFWKRCRDNGDIYKKEYKVKYCVGCELEKMESELVDGKCPQHPNQEIEFIEEENYFFRFSNYQDRLLALYEETPDFVLPRKRLNEIRNFIENGPQDFSISRLKEKMPWGVEVPDDPDHVMYVWFDALVNYISTIGWPEDMDTFYSWWPVVQIAGKDNLRQQSAMWQAMLMSAGVQPSKQILLNGFITVDGQKMSKSLGNVIGPKEMVQRYGVDGTRYLLLTMARLGEDADINWQWLDEKYNADLANGLGNLVSRVMKLSEDIDWEFGDPDGALTDDILQRFGRPDIYGAMELIWEKVRGANKYIEKNKPWELRKTDPEGFERVMKKLLEDLKNLAFLLKPAIPSAAEKMELMLREGKREMLFERV